MTIPMFYRSPQIERLIEGLTPTRQLFQDESTLLSFILANRDELDEFRSLGFTGFKQVKLDSGRRVDLLCERPALNQLVGIELKVREPDDRAAGQVEQYLEDLAEHARNHGYDSAHLILIAGQPDKSVRNQGRTLCSNPWPHGHVSSLQGAVGPARAPMMPAVRRRRSAGWLLGASDRQH